jgi:hypothetical protein
VLLAGALLCAVVAHGAAEQPAEPLPLPLDRTQTLEQEGVSVSVSIPTEAESERLFGLPLASHGIQPIWLRIENASEVDYWLLPIAIDPDYYSADEVALVAGARLSHQERTEAIGLLRANSLPFFVAAGGASEGYVYATHVRGGRFVDVRLTGHLRAVRLRFAVLLPTEGFDYERSALRELYAKEQEQPDLTAEELRLRLREELSC